VGAFDFPSEKDPRKFREAKPRQPGIQPVQVGSGKNAKKNDGRESQLWVDEGSHQAKHLSPIPVN
jgi:hypothetical protein